MRRTQRRELDETPADPPARRSQPPARLGMPARPVPFRRRRPRLRVRRSTMSRLSGRNGSVGREVAALLADWEQGRLSRRSVLRRAAALGLTVPALAVLAGKAGTGRTQAAVLRAAQDDPASGTPGGTLRIANI